VICLSYMHLHLGTVRPCTFVRQITRAHIITITFYSCNMGMRALPECSVLQVLCNTCQANSLKLFALGDQSPKPT